MREILSLTAWVFCMLWLATIALTLFVGSLVLVAHIVKLCS